MSPAEAAPPLPAGSLGSLTRRGVRRFAGTDKLLAISLAVCCLIVLVAIVGPLVAPYSPSKTDVLNANQPPSAAHLLGTDALGRDLFSRLLVGARLSILGPALAVSLALAMGTALAIAAVWFGGWLNRAVVRAVNVMFAFPALLIALIAVAVFEPGFVAPALALALAYTPYMARVIRSVAVRERNSAYIEACELLGYSGWRVCLRHLLPNLRPLILTQATIGFGIALVDLAGISFLGLGVQPPTAEWGLMVAEGRTELLNGYPQQTLAAGLAIVVTVVAFNLLGERLSQRSGGGR